MMFAQLRFSIVGNGMLLAWQRRWHLICHWIFSSFFLSLNLSKGSSVEQRVGFWALTAKTQATATPPAAPLAAPMIAPAGANGALVLILHA